MTKEQRLQQIKQMRKAGVSRKEMADLLGVSLATISKDIKSLELSHQLERVETKKEQIIRLYEQGYSFEEIAKLAGFSGTSISKKLAEWGYHQKRNRYDVVPIDEHTLWAKPRKKAVPCVVNGKSYLDVTEIFCPG